MSCKRSENMIPTVMSDSLLETCALKTYCDTPEAHKVVDADGLPFSIVEVLHMEFKNILKISNLWDFSSLKILVLSNNRIEKIEGLDALINLKILDLSYNNIEVVDGLVGLKSLSDLSLTNNRIRKVENLQSLTSLQLLALKENKISDFKCVQSFYGFKTLSSISFVGNPIADDPNYKHKVLAYIPNLSYLDYRLISREEKIQAIENYKEEVTELEDKQKIKEKADKERMNREETKQLYSEAFLENMCDNQFLDDYLRCDIDSQLLFQFSLFSDIFNDFASNFRNSCNDWIQIGLKEHERRKNELEDYIEASKEHVNETLLFSQEKVSEFIDLKDDLFHKIFLNNYTDEEEKLEYMTNMKKFDMKIESLWKNLMTSEMEQKLYLGEVQRLFQKEMQLMVDEYISKVKKYIQQLHSLNDSLLENAVKFYSDWCSKSFEEKLQVVKTGANESEELIELLKLDELASIVTNGYDKRVVFLETKESSIESRLKLWCSTILKRSFDKQLEGHRQRIKDFTSCCETAEKELDTALKYLNFYQLSHQR